MGSKREEVRCLRIKLLGVVLVLAVLATLALPVVLADNNASNNPPATSNGNNNNNPPTTAKP